MTTAHARREEDEEVEISIVMIDTEMVNQPGGGGGLKREGRKIRRWERECRR